MDSFRRAGTAVKRIVICFILALVCVALVFIVPFQNLLGRPENATYVLFGLAGVLLLVSIFSTISVLLWYLEGCQESLDKLAKIEEHLRAIMWNYKSGN